MADTAVGPLEPIIRKVNGSHKTQSGEVLVSIREKTGVVNPGIGFGTTHKYMVRNVNALGAQARGQTGILHVSNPESDETVNFRLSYQAVCPEGQETKLVEGLGRFGDPNGEINRIMSATARDTLWGKEYQLFTDFDDLKGQVLDAVTQSVIAATGLQFRVQLKIELQDSLGAFHVDEVVPVRFSDLQIEHRIRLQCDLDIVPKLTLRAVVGYQRLPQLKNKIIQVVQDFFRLKACAQDYVSELDSLEFVDALRVEIADVCETEGRTVSGITISGKDQSNLPELIVEKELTREVRTLDRGEAIQLTSKVLLTLDNYGVFRGSNVSDLTNWLNETFEKVVTDVCFEKRYIDFLRNDTWQQIENRIRGGMEEAAQKIGYHVKQIFSAPEMKENKYGQLRHHRFSIENLPLKSTARAHVDLTVDATFCITDWERISLSSKINQGIDLDSNIYSELHDALSMVLIQETPNDFILKFSEKPDESGSSIEDRLESAVMSRLQDEFEARVPNVVITQVDTPEIKRIRHLMNSPQSLQLTTRSTTGGEQVLFDITWRINTLMDNSWDKIERATTSIESIGGEIKKALRGYLSTLTYHELRYESHEERQKLENSATKVANSVLREIFGLGVNISNLQRAQTRREKVTAEAEDEAFDIDLGKYMERVRQVQVLQSADLKQNEDLQQIAHDDQKSALSRYRLLVSKGRADLTRAEEEELKGLEQREDLSRTLAERTGKNIEMSDVPSISTEEFQHHFIGRRKESVPRLTAGKSDTHADEKVKKLDEESEEGNP